MQPVGKLRLKSTVGRSPQLVESQDGYNLVLCFGNAKRCSIISYGLLFFLDIYIILLVATTYIETAVEKS
jgi:hypothetical protein